MVKEQYLCIEEHGIEVCLIDLSVLAVIDNIIIDGFTSVCNTGALMAVQFSFFGLS